MNSFGVLVSDNSLDRWQASVSLAVCSASLQELVSDPFRFAQGHEAVGKPWPFLASWRNQWISVGPQRDNSSPRFLKIFDEKWVDLWIFVEHTPIFCLRVQLKSTDLLVIMVVVVDWARTYKTGTLLRCGQSWLSLVCWWFDRFSHINHHNLRDDNLASFFPTFFWQIQDCWEVFIGLLRMRRGHIAAIPKKSTGTFIGKLRRPCWLKPAQTLRLKKRSFSAFFLWHLRNEP